MKYYKSGIVLAKSCRIFAKGAKNIV